MDRLSFSPRRKFLKQLGTGLAAGTISPTIAIAKQKHKSILPAGQIDEKYWEMVKQQFAIAPDKLMVNAANLCASPYLVHDKVDQLSKDLATDVSFQNRNKYAVLRKKAIDAISHFLGVSNKEIGITRNTSEANNIVVNGLDFGPKDEVIIWDQNHPTNNVSWKHRAKRMGFNVVEIKMPQHPKSKEDLLKPIESAITPQTRLIAFSHISNVSGIKMPEKEICALANSKNIMTLIDGAQSLGFMNLNLNDIGCTFYSSSSHKWLMGPMENGVIYVNEAHQEKLWPNIIAAGWTPEYQSLDKKICVLGQRNTPATAAMGDIIQFHKSVGKSNIEARVRQLCNSLKNGIREAIPSAQFVTPLKEELSGGVVILSIPGKDNKSIFEKLYNDYGIACAPTGGIRLSPTINCILEDMERVVGALKSLSQ